MSTAHLLHLTPAHERELHCSECGVHELCMPAGLSSHDLVQLDSLVSERIRCRKGDQLFHAGHSFSCLYAVRFGQFKTTLLTRDGREQVCGFQMAGDILGLDGIDRDAHQLTAIALEDAEVCVIAYAQLNAMSLQVPTLARNLPRIMSREIMHDHQAMLVLGSLRADERVAVFLSGFLERLQARGFSPSDLVLRMTREDIGSYLGLTIETVSRIFSKLAARGILAVQNKNIHVLDLKSLKDMNPQTCTRADIH